MLEIFTVEKTAEIQTVESDEEAPQGDEQDENHDMNQDDTEDEAEIIEADKNKPKENPTAKLKTTEETTNMVASTSFSTNSRVSRVIFD